MNQNQIKVLRDYGYDVIPEINLINENTFTNPNCYIIYDPNEKLFSIGIKHNTITIPQSTTFILELISKIELADKLNQTI